MADPFFKRKFWRSDEAVRFLSTESFLLLRMSLCDDVLEKEGLRRVIFCAELRVNTV